MTLLVIALSWAKTKDLFGVDITQSEQNSFNLTI